MLRGGAGVSRAYQRFLLYDRPIFHLLFAELRGHGDKLNDRRTTAAMEQPADVSLAFLGGASGEQILELNLGDAYSDRSF